jgi:hypothetical protein
MGNSTKNIAIILGILTIGAGGYWLYTQEMTNGTDFEQTEATRENMLNRTQVFIERRQKLDQVELDISFFEKNSFRSLESHTTEIQEQPVGRSNPFAEVEVGSGSN